MSSTADRTVAASDEFVSAGPVVDVSGAVCSVASCVANPSVTTASVSGFSSVGDWI